MTPLSARLRVLVDPTDHSQGREDASITLVEYGDYECSYCGAAYSIIKRIQREFGDDLRFVFRNFPITSSHPDAMSAALAAEAAGFQGKFWEMHDLLYENQKSLDPNSLIRHATALGLELDRFRKDLLNPETEEKVKADQYGGMRSGVRGTPGFFINGFRYDEDWSYPSFSAMLNQLRRKASA